MIAKDLTYVKSFAILNATDNKTVPEGVITDG